MEPAWPLGSLLLLLGCPQSEKVFLTCRMKFTFQLTFVGSSSPHALLKEPDFIFLKSSYLFPGRRRLCYVALRQSLSRLNKPHYLSFSQGKFASSDQFSPPLVLLQLVSVFPILEGPKNEQSIQLGF